MDDRMMGEAMIIVALDLRVEPSLRSVELS
jgi:hypothetical protein